MLKQVLNRVLIPNFCFTCVLIWLPKFPKHPASGATPPGCHHRVHPHVHPSHGYRTNWAWPCRRSTWQLGWVQWATCRAQTQKLDKITWKMLVSNMVWLKMSFKFGGVSQTWINLGDFYLMKKRLENHFKHVQPAQQCCEVPLPTSYTAELHRSEIPLGLPGLSWITIGFTTC